MSKSTATKPVITVESLVAEHAATAGPKRKGLRDSWSVKMRDAFMSGDTDTAKLYGEALPIAESLSNTRSSVTVEIDWRSVTIDRIAELRMAADLIESGAVRPAGTPDDADLTDLDLDSGTVHDVTESATKLATVRLAGTRSVPTFIAERIAELGDGFHTASDLARGQVDAPSTGAIGAVWEKMTDKGFVVEGVVAGHTEDGRKAFSA